MKNLFSILQLITSILLIGAILMQARSTGFSVSSGPKSFTRRGLEKVIFKATFVLSGLFILFSALQFLI